MGWGDRCLLVSGQVAVDINAVEEDLPARPIADANKYFKGIVSKLKHV